MGNTTHKFKDHTIQKVELVGLLPTQKAVEIYIKPNYDMVRFTESDLLVMLAMIKLKPGEDDG